MVQVTIKQGGEGGGASFLVTKKQKSQLSIKKSAPFSNIPLLAFLCTVPLWFFLYCDSVSTWCVFALNTNSTNTNTNILVIFRSSALTRVILSPFDVSFLLGSWGQEVVARHKKSQAFYLSLLPWRLISYQPAAINREALFGNTIGWEKFFFCICLNFKIFFVVSVFNVFV